jgi:hypothetical protein
MTGIVDIDHLMIGVADADRAAKAIETLGFTTTPPSIMPAIGLANRCVLFTPRAPGVANYLELLAHDHARASPFMRDLLAGEDAIKSLVLGTDDIEQARASLAANLAPCTPARRIARRWDAPGGPLDLAFSVATPALGTPPIYCNPCQHHTLRHYLREEWRRHPNGARALVAVLVEAPDPAEVGAWFARLFAHAPSVAIEARRGPRPRAYGFAVAVDDPRATDGFLRGRGVIFAPGPAVATEALGCRIEFRRDEAIR